ncbi:transposase [Streptomyces fuscichromogenes]
MEDRQVINGMIRKIWTGISWHDLPKHPGPWKAVCSRCRAPLRG